MRVTKLIQEKRAIDRNDHLAGGKNSCAKNYWW